MSLLRRVFLRPLPDRTAESSSASLLVDEWNGLLDRISHRHCGLVIGDGVLRADCKRSGSVRGGIAPDYEMNDEVL
jgi:hypothetical protein